ncbi:RNA pyrophosphohydrolase [Actibacterium sp. 188UL27-1]|uniref:RNA pyrophosphohydrolase n=1 Tax=Actibacterium sp. 188UL27-1 TaxID=2786961 RepID=UPI00195DD447|nr:RNA pyrophosphohydrolase [Actibacterium sp. 188UL27-1]MBM7067079.1 RNA pyrophosphohydrolase [Actibacterium sp. 188UL27-1]
MTHHDLPYRPCVGVMLLNADGHVFVGQRLDSDLVAWQMPQGGIDPGEDPRTAALRELEEETGITSNLVTVMDETSDWLAYDLPDSLQGKLWGGRFRGQKQLWVLMRFDGSDAQVNIQTSEPEFSDWRWLPPGELSANIVPFKREIYEQVLDAFRGHFP